MIYTYRMISGLRQLMQNANISFRDGSSREHCFAKVCSGNYLRTGKSKQNTTRTNLLNGPRVQFFIALKCLAQCASMLRKGRWIKDNQIIFIIDVLHKIECICSKSFMTGIAWKIQFN